MAVSKEELKKAVKALEIALNAEKNDLNRDDCHRLTVDHHQNQLYQ